MPPIGEMSFVREGPANVGLLAAYRMRHRALCRSEYDPSRMALPELPPAAIGKFRGENYISTKMDWVLRPLCVLLREDTGGGRGEGEAKRRASNGGGRTHDDRRQQQRGSTQHKW